MTISEVIAALQSVMSERGDLEVLQRDDYDDFVVESVDIVEAYKYSDEGHKTPEYVVLSGDRRLWYDNNTNEWVEFSKATDTK